MNTPVLPRKPGHSDLTAKNYDRIFPKAAAGRGWGSRN
jgi:hypothetical protein